MCDSDPRNRMSAWLSFVRYLSFTDNSVACIDHKTLPTKPKRKPEKGQDKPNLFLGGDNGIFTSTFSYVLTHISSIHVIIVSGSGDGTDDSQICVCESVLFLWLQICKTTLRLSALAVGTSVISHVHTTTHQRQELTLTATEMLHSYWLAVTSLEPDGSRLALCPWRRLLGEDWSRAYC